MQTVNLLKPVELYFIGKQLSKINRLPKETKMILLPKQYIPKVLLSKQYILLYTQTLNVHILLLYKGRGMLRYTIRYVIILLADTIAISHIRCK